MGALLQLRLLCFALLGLLLATTGTFASIRACHAGEHAFLAANSTGPALATAAVSTTQGSSTESSTRLALIPPAAVQPTYDLDGNLLQDGLWSFLWDGSNRLIQMESLPSWPAGANRLKLRFAYDAAGRRIHKQVFQEVNLNGSKTYVLKLDRRFLYDGWNLIAELDPDGSPARTYLWGTDLSGSAQGAGGVGGLLAIHILKGPASAVGVHFPFYDGNGNVTGLTSAATGMETARYSYDAFGVELRASGPAAQANPFHFSTKFTDEESGLVYFGFRYYDPSAGRWLSRDPIGEQGGVNLYGMVRNDPVNSVDTLGLNAHLTNLTDTNGLKYVVDDSLNNYTLFIPSLNRWVPISQEVMFWFQFGPKSEQEEDAQRILLEAIKAANKPRDLLGNLQKLESLCEVLKLSPLERPQAYAALERLEEAKSRLKGMALDLALSLAPEVAPVLISKAATIAATVRAQRAAKASLRAGAIPKVPWHQAGGRWNPLNYRVSPTFNMGGAQFYYKAPVAQAAKTTVTPLGEIVGAYKGGGLNGLRGVGNPGSSATIREVAGISGADEASAFFNHITAGGTLKVNTPGLRVAEMPDGSFVTFRPAGKVPNATSGVAPPTIDVNIPGTDHFKLKLLP